MKGISPRFSAPLDVPRPRGGRLIEGFNPKLGRLVRFFDHAVFAQWIALEADTSVTAFCERPARVGDKSDSRVVDFWVQRGDRQEMLLLEDRQAGTDLTASRVHGIPLRMVPPAELAADAIWVANWQRMFVVADAKLTGFCQCCRRSNDSGQRRRTIMGTRCKQRRLGQS